MYRAGLTKTIGSETLGQVFVEKIWDLLACLQQGVNQCLCEVGITIIVE